MFRVVIIIIWLGWLIIVKKEKKNFYNILWVKNEDLMEYNEILK